MFFHKKLKEFIGNVWSNGTMDWGVCDRLKNIGGHIYVSLPSVVQHIGIEGQNSTLGRYDFATDFI